MIATKTKPKPIQHNGHPPPITLEKLKRISFYERGELLSVISDLLLLNACLVLWFKLSTLDITISTSAENSFYAFLISANIIWLGVALFNDIYKWYEITRPSKRVQTLIYVIGIYFAILTSCYYYIFFSVLAINFLVPVFISFIFTCIPTHLFFRKFYLKRMPIFKYAVVGGKPSNLEYLHKVFSNSFGRKSNCIGWFGERPIPSERWLGDYSELRGFIKNNSFDKLLYICSDLERWEVKHIIKLCDSRFIDFEIVPREMDLIKGGIFLTNQDDLPILTTKKEPLQRHRNKILKRGFDIIFSLLVIVTIFPWLFLIIAVLIKLESKGPIFFLQERTGYWNQPFQFIKFRSMRVNEESNSKQAIRQDDRITKIGAFLRKTSLDELPQFFNVLKGDMSVVGPRPHMIEHTKQYAGLIETYLVRHKVKPGITGWAQINGYRGPTETLNKMEKRVEYDVHYMKKWTILMDIRCVIMTVVNMIIGEKNAV